MKRLKIGDRIIVSGGYDMEPAWLQGTAGHSAVVTGFFENHIENRKGDAGISAAIEFDNEIEYKGIKGKYGFLLGRYKDQTWDAENSGVHVQISSIPINSDADIQDETSVWAESHASYKQIST